MSRPRLLLDVEQQLVDADDVVHVSGERRAEDGRDADRVLVEVRLHVVGADRVLVLLERDDPRFDVEVAAELLPHHVDVSSEHEVRPFRRAVRCLLTLLPLPLQGQGAEHDRLGRALGPAAGRLARRRVEQVGQHPHAALLDLGGDRVLGVVDEVAVEVLGDDPLRLGLHPGRHERRQVALRVAFDGEVLVRPVAWHRRGASRSRGRTVEGAASVRNRLPKSASASVSLSFVMVAADHRSCWIGCVECLDDPADREAHRTCERPPVDEPGVDRRWTSPDG